MTSSERSAREFPASAGAGMSGGRSEEGLPAESRLAATSAAGPAGNGETSPCTTQRRDMARLVRGIHERCGRHVAQAFSELLRTHVDVRLHDVEFVEYRQFILDVESPTCLAVMRAEPLDVPLALDLRPTLLFAMLNCLLGGRPRDEDPPERPLTEIEQRLAGRIVRVWTHELRSAWRDVAPLEPVFERWEAHPHRASLAPLREPLMVTRFRLTMGSLDELLTLAIPRRAIDELPRRLSVGEETSFGRASAGARLSTADAAVDQGLLEVCLEEFRVASGDLASLRIGDVIATSHAAAAPLVVTIDGEPRYVGRPGVVQGRRAVCIEGERGGDQGAGVLPGVDEGNPAELENQR